MEIMRQNVIYFVFAHLSLAEMDCEVRVRGIYEHPSNCKMFFTCNEGNSNISECPQDLYFNVEQKSCTEAKYLSSERTKYCVV